MYVPIYQSKHLYIYTSGEPEASVYLPTYLYKATTHTHMYIAIHLPFFRSTHIYMYIYSICV